MKKSHLLLALLLLPAALLAQSAPPGAGTPPRPRPPTPEPHWVLPEIDAIRCHRDIFHSQSAGADVSCYVYIPPGYEESGDTRYPVMYWLHGIGGNFAGVPVLCERLHNAITAGKAPPMIAVFVNGMVDSFYCDAVDAPRPVESVIIKDLIPHIDSTYRTLATRDGRLIEGFSMGGFGAGHLGFKYPELFGSVSMLDAALVGLDAMKGRHHEIFQRVFDGREDLFTASQPSTLVEKNSETIRGHTTIRIITGPLAAPNRVFDQKLTDLDIKHAFTELQGVRHAYVDFYERIGEANWDFYRQIFAHAPAPIADQFEPATTAPEVEQPVRPRAADHPHPPAGPRNFPPPEAPGYEAHRDLVYARPDNLPQTLDVFVPEHTKNPLPLIIWVHGGGWQSGSKEQNLALRWGRPGYVIASLNYRLSGVAPFPANIQDCKAAIRWLRAHASEYHIDTNRVGVWGSSAGGHLVSLIGTSGDTKKFDVGENLEQSSAVQAVADFYGPQNLSEIVVTPHYQGHAKADSPESKMLGGAVLEHPDIAQAANPMAYVDASTPPFLIVHGTKDPIVPPPQSQELYDSLHAAGVPASLHYIEGARHGGPEFSQPEVFEWVEKFFAQYLGANK